VVLIRGKGAFLASYSGPRAHYLRLDPAQVGGLVAALWEVLGREEEEEYLDIDTTRQGSQGWPYGHLGALLALMGGAFRQDPELGRRVVEAALRAYTADLCSSLRAEPGGGGMAGGGSPFLSEGASSSHYPPRPDEEGEKWTRACAREFSTLEELHQHALSCSVVNSPPPWAEGEEGGE
jgi:hypothetical protein